MQKIETPVTIFLIGATGDLAKRRIWKALFKLFEQQIFPPHFTVIGVARAEYELEDFRTFLKDVVQPRNEANWTEFAKKIKYFSADVSNTDCFQELVKFHESFEQCGNHLWYVATLPSLYLPVIQNIKAANFQKTNCGWTKFLLEKPFGTDVPSSQKLNEELLQVFEEEQIYRIDHFLAKETVQNLLVFRFGNGLFEHLWNNKFVDHIQVTSSESLGIGGRGEFFDSTGTVRDILQNHVLQMLAMTLMEEPMNLEPAEIRRKRMEFLAQLEGFSPLDLPTKVLFGQYAAGTIDGEDVPGYLEEQGIPEHSRTETAVAGKMFVDSDRWRGVPIYFRAGKRMKATYTEISLKFKEPANQMFSQFDSPQTGNVLTLRIQPNEGVIVRLNVKKPGLDLSMGEVSMQFCYNTQFQMGLVEAYEKLLYDAIQGDPTLFPQAADIEASWKLMQPILDYLKQPDVRPALYEAGTWGPSSFDTLLQEDGRIWIEPSPDVCEVHPKM